MKRREFTKKTKLAAYKRAAGKCEGCAQPLQAGRFHYDHDKAAGLGGDNSLENAKVLCTLCHRHKTNVRDMPPIRKADRQRHQAIGARQPGRSIPAPPKAPKREPKPMPPRRPLYGDIDNG
jgi:5-methylcytosine-specific restriction endonuclease McrA